MNFGCAGDEVRIYGDYSGRAMYGDTCAAIVAPDESTVAQILVGLSSYDHDAAQRLAECQRIDSMGLSIVAYYPGVALDGEGDEDLDD